MDTQEEIDHTDKREVPPPESCKDCEGYGCSHCRGTGLEAHRRKKFWYENHI